MVRVELSLEAQRDLLEIAAHITTESGSRQRGEDFLEGVFATCETLVAPSCDG